MRKYQHYIKMNRYDMDSLTQIALGGAVGYAVMGKQIGRRAALYGAAFGTLPDLDVFWPYAGEVEAFTYHRSLSHSLLVQLIISPVLAWLIARYDKYAKDLWARCTVMVLLCLSTHALLDSGTVYGTQLLWPLSEYPFGVSNLFIIDPLYTLPLLLALIVAMIPKFSQQHTHKINAFGLIISTFYIGWSLGAKIYIDHKLESALDAKAIQYNQFLSTPAPLTTLLWRAVIMHDDHYYEAYVSVFDTPQDISFDKYSTQPFLLDSIQEQWGVKRLQWFTHGFYAIKQAQDKVYFSDLRMGVECSYVFNFQVGQITPSGVIASDYSKFSARPSLDKIPLIWDRIWDAGVSLAPKLPCTN